MQNNMSSEELPRIASFDQASSKTGYAIFSGTNLTRWGVLDQHKEKDANIRFKYMCSEIDTIIDRVDPDVVVFEDVNLRTSVKTLIMLARIQGCIMQSCFLHNIPFVIYSPVTWRKIVGINQSNRIERKELKEQAIAFVKNSYGIKVGDDCSEAICEGLAYLKEHNYLPELTNLKRSSRKKENLNNGKKAE